MSSVRLHPLTLRFGSRHLETVFRLDYARRSVVLVRWALVLGLVQYAGFGLLDRWVVPSSQETVLVIRIVVCAVLAAGVAYTFSPRFIRTMQRAVALVPLAGGLGVVAMMLAAQQADGYYQYYVGMVLILIYVHVLLRLRFVVASAVGGVLIALCLAAAVAVETPPYVLANNAFYLLSANLSGMVASYALERYARIGFAQDRQQSRSYAELRRVLDGLRMAQARLVHQEKMASLGRLTSGVAHEIKNPLNFITNFARLSVELAADVEETVHDGRGRLVDEIEPELAELLADLKGNAAAIAEHGARADAVVRQMQEHARPAGQAQRPVDFNAVVAQHVELGQHAAQARHGLEDLKLEVELDPELGLVVAVPQEIGRVVLNLLANACYAVAEHREGAPAGYVPTVRVVTRRIPSGAYLEVSDNGPGLTEAEADRALEPFFTTKPPGQGAGLGLSLASEIVSSYGGVIAHGPRLGGGAVFSVRLPLAPHAEPRSEEALELA